MFGNALTLLTGHVELVQWLLDNGADVFAKVRNHPATSSSSLLPSSLELSDTKVYEP